MKLIDLSLLSDLAERAAASPRRRQHFNLHASYDDPCQRLLNYLWRDSYIRPHRHAADPKEETLIALHGAMGCIGFDDDGTVTRLVRLTADGSDGGCPAVVVEPGEWHTIVALSETALLLEAKAGPFDPAAAKEPAPWAAGEGGGHAGPYLRSLQMLFD